MSYMRVIPRDLFNEANLLKCYGQLWLKLEPYFNSGIKLIFVDEAIPWHAPFDIQQDPSNGSLTIKNIILTIHGKTFELERPLNSRDPWPLYANDYKNHESFKVFTEDGHLNPEFLEVIRTLE